MSNQARYDDDESVAALKRYNEIAGTCYSKGNYERALRYYEKALYETNYIFEVMKRESEEFQKIKKFLYRYSTENLCPYKKLELLELYKLRDRDSNFKEYEYLFWLGCETPHLYSILRHGLRFPMKLESSKIYNYGPGIMISHNPYAQLQYCIARNNIAYLSSHSDKDDAFENRRLLMSNFLKLSLKCTKTKD